MHLTKKVTTLNMNERLEVSSDISKQLKAVFNAYINLKDALVKEDSKSTSDNAKNLLE